MLCQRAPRRMGSHLPRITTSRCKAAHSRRWKSSSPCRSMTMSKARARSPLACGINFCGAPSRGWYGFAMFSAFCGIIWRAGVVGMTWTAWSIRSRCRARLKCTFNEAIAIIEAHGFVLHSQRGTSHRQYLHPDGRRTTIAAHDLGDNIRPDTLKSIIRQCCLSEWLFRK
jgi:predicted RNA binding protein YcfA (HicA-like mRNA interferase family)